jgi:dTDP-4-dehydrorhamnose 3,5-epimerase
MFFHPLPLRDAFLISLDQRKDERGMFARVFCRQEFSELGLEYRYVQANLSTNDNAGTIRGLHYQKSPHMEVKLVRCIRGAIFDVIVDLREESASFFHWYGVELSEENGLMLYVPRGFAHGYQTLRNNASVHYMVSAYYAPGFEGGCRYDDPALGIKWPFAVSSISDKDAAWPLLTKTNK